MIVENISANLFLFLLESNRSVLIFVVPCRALTSMTTLD